MRADGNIDALAAVRNGRATILIEIVTPIRPVPALGHIKLGAKGKKRSRIDVRIHLIVDRKGSSSDA